MRAAFLLLLALSQVAMAAEVTTSVDSNQVALGVPFLVTLHAEGTAVGEVKLPQDLKGVEISRQPIRSFTNYSFGSGAASASVEYGFRATATETGRITIPPFGVKIDGQMVFSKPIELTVTPAAMQVAPPRGDRRPPERQEINLEDAVFVTSEVDKAEVVEQEPMKLTLSLWQLDNEALDVDPYRDIPPPTTEGFYATPRMPQYVAESEETRDGRQYRVRRFQQILYPTQAGELTIGEWNWKGAVRFWGRSGTQYRDIILRAAPVKVRVLPLPQPRPADFRGAVGRYRVEGDVTESQVAQEMPTKLVVRIIGEGNPAAIGEPVLPEIPGTHVSDPERVDVPISDPHGISVEKDFVYTVTPTRPGRLHIPEITYTFFDIGARQYSTQRVGPFDIEVRASGETGRRVVVDAATPQDAPSEEMAPLDLNPGTLATEPPWGLVAAVTGIVPPLAYGALALFMARRRRFQHDVRYARSYHARSRALRRLDAVGTISEPSDELFRALAGYVADKCAVTESGMTSADVARLLEANGVSDELRDGYLKILRACERVRYGGSELSGTEQDALAHAAHANVDALEAEWRRAGR
ncbi:MAG: BatD family protein [FCB group bacterium]|nr:BatD family protein [FCB group bacterium]